METPNYEKLIEKIYSAFETGDADALDNYLDENIVEHTPDPNVPQGKKGIEYFKEQLRIYDDAFPNGSFNIQEIFVKGDKAIAWVSVKAKNTGEFNGMPPTNKEVKMDFCEMFKFKNNKVTDHWQVADNLSFMQQLGIISEKELQEKMAKH